MKLFFGMILAFTVATGALGNTVFSQQIDVNVAQGIEISPGLVELNAEKGKTYEIRLSVTNVTTSDLVYTTEINNFGSGNESGSPKVILDDSALPKTASITSWVDNISGFDLKSRQEKQLNIKVNVPSDAEPGGHYGVIRFSGTAPEVESNGVGLSASAGVLLLIRVAGDIVENASLASFFTANKDGSQSSFFENSPITFVTRIKNDGNVHVKPSGSIELRDMFGNLVATIPVNEDKSNILPNSIRRFDQAKIDNPWMFGLYTANLALGYGSSGQAITNTITFWVIPYKIILAALALLATIIYVIRSIMKAYIRRIIEKAKNENTKNENNTKNNTKKKG